MSSPRVTVGMRKDDALRLLLAEFLLNKSVSQPLESEVEARIARARSIVEAGCGCGRVMNKIALSLSGRSDLFGIERDPQAAALARWRLAELRPGHRWHVVVGDFASDGAWRGLSPDVILCLGNTLAGLSASTVKRLISMARRALTAGGRILIDYYENMGSVPSSPHPLSPANLEVPTPNGTLACALTSKIEFLTEKRGFVERMHCTLYCRGETKMNFSLVSRDFRHPRQWISFLLVVQGFRVVWTPFASIGPYRPWLLEAQLVNNGDSDHYVSLQQ